MNFVGVSSGEQARRGYWRVVLAGDVLDAGFLFGNPLQSWPDRVEKWRAAVDEGGAMVAASCSTASATEGTIYAQRAVIDVHILGAEQGETVGQVARRLSDLVSNIDVIAVYLVNNADPVARDALLRNEKTKADKDPLGLDKLVNVIALGLKLAAAVAVVYVAAQLVKAVRSK